MFATFEGPEKKIELCVSSSHPSLRALGDDWWTEVVSRAGAQIISKLSNEHVDAYLLSESSLFVFEHRLLMITCGRTRLVDAIEFLLGRLSIDEITMLAYQRKNEVFPEQQPTTFYEDARRLGSMMPGRAFRFGDEDGHHIMLFHLDRAYTPARDDMTLEVLMHGIGDDARALFRSGPEHTLEQIHARARLSELLPGFEIDEHIFEPDGYSLNAIRGREYYTIHVTPQEVGSYVSFETNHVFDGPLGPTINRLLEIFGPESYDVFFFEADERSRSFGVAGQVRREVQHRVMGYDVRFSHYFERVGVQDAFELKLRG